MVDLIKELQNKDDKATYRLFRECQQVQMHLIISDAGGKGRLNG